MKIATVIMILAVLIGVVAGCSGGTTAEQDDKELRKQLSKPKIDMNDVPPNQRAMVQGYIDKANAMRAKAEAHGK